MESNLTVRDLIAPGEPLDPSEVLAAGSRMENPVTWVVSLRPYPPAFPRLRGGELALVATEHVLRLDPPTTLADVVRQLTSRGAAGLAVRGPVDPAGIEAADEAGLPLLRLHDDAPLPDIEQAIMRVCALHQARREMLPHEAPGAWVESLLAGRLTSEAEIQSAAHRHGVRVASEYITVYVPSNASGPEAVRSLASEIHNLGRSDPFPPLAAPVEGGLAVLLAASRKLPVALFRSVQSRNLPMGIGAAMPLLEAPEGLSQAMLAATASLLLQGCKPVTYSELGADRLLLVLHRDRLVELRDFVHKTLGPLLEHDASSASPLLPTLEAYVTRGGRLRDTAAGIYIHRNTLAYRLDRAAELLGADLKDPPTRLSIELALRALPLVQPTHS